MQSGPLFSLRSLSGRTCHGLGSLPDLVRHPLTEIAVLGLLLAPLHERDAGPAMGNAVAIENSQVHEAVAKDMSDDRGERLPAVNVGKESIAGKLVGDEWVINGEKYYISGAGDPRCKIMIVMVKTNPDAPPSKQQSQILVPIDTPGVEILEPMHVFGHDHAPRGHMHLRFNNCRVPKENMLLGEGRGFEISQVRLEPAASIIACARSARRKRRST